MFDAEPLREQKPRRPASQRSIKQGHCPMCLRGATGLIRMGVHLVWRPHTYRTWGGTQMPCAASGVAVCVAPERPPYRHARAVRCPH